jgi:hypothetical protein
MCGAVSFSGHDSSSRFGARMTRQMSSTLVLVGFWGPLADISYIFKGI